MMEKTERETDFVTLCHGEPWIGTIYFKYDRSEQDSNDESVGSSGWRNERSPNRIIIYNIFLFMHNFTEIFT